MSSSVPSPAPHPQPKLHLSTTSLPPYISPTQPPTKKTPFRQIKSVHFIRCATLIFPSELYDLIISHLPSPLLQPHYAKLLCPLSAFLDGPLFNHIRQPGSNILALSEGKPGVDDQFLLHEGKLRLDLGKERYQRSGLQGLVVKETGARRHVKSRWRVNLDLRAPSSVAGKKGFERLRVAGKPNGVLGDGRAWLVCDAESISQGEGKGSILDAEVVGGIHPTICEAKQEVKNVEGVLLPDMMRRWTVMEQTDEEEWWELVEWLDLVALGSPRVVEGDQVDTYMSRYSVPQPATKGNLRVLKWEGLLSSEWMTSLLIEIIKLSRARKSTHWIALSATGHQTEAVGGVDGYTVLLQPGQVGGPVEKNGEDVQQQADTMDLEGKDAEVMDHEGTGLQHCVCFQFIDSVVT